MEISPFEGVLGLSLALYRISFCYVFLPLYIYTVFLSLYIVTCELPYKK